ncbi:hypothetical protein HK097_010046 [Rhizophlyctis rosea]|uniref:NAD(P)-binding protein n=1 Tax=Rhizophlyctis rosea TaxID=64517 RepID=A0AAD5S9R5_9FUNG|nr:hypothetical protein HK097_010046 [Rhizophlyctis rosea]
MAIVIGATRGIGSQIAITLSTSYHVIIAGRSTPSSPSSQYGGDIQYVAEAIKAKGGTATPIQCDVRKVGDIENLVRRSEELGAVEVVVYNAGAISWGSVKDAPLKRFDLLQEVNIRGLYAVIQMQLPHFLKRNRGKFIVVSPPIYSRFFRGKTPYAIGKVGMTVLTQGLSLELSPTNISITSLWPATAIESAVTTHQNIAPKFLRKPSIFADAVLKIATFPDASKLNGLALIDEDFLREWCGVVDFERYRVGGYMACLVKGRRCTHL